jgi:hypothetical protein
VYAYSGNIQIFNTAETNIFRSVNFAIARTKTTFHYMTIFKAQKYSLFRLQKAINYYDATFIHCKKYFF